ncbi:hypothetical protein [Litorimonas taeanensis]|uniref:hypothetical protein n=1 Tax=Litorimonas taeanensis TaxID=568099 RepID=UPI000EB12DF0|nr:hypothetical protein [Litorimonas taeanensis]
MLGLLVYLADVPTELPLRIVALSDASETWSLKLSGQNLSDEENYFTGFAPAEDIAAFGILRPRTWMVTFSYKM